MNRFLTTVLLSCVAMPLSAQRPEDAADPTKPLPDPVQVRQLDLQVDQAARLATLSSSDGSMFFGFIVGSTSDNTVRLAGFELLQYEAIVATALAKDGNMALDLGKGGWGFDVYLQGVALFENNEALASNIAVVTDK